MLKLFKSSRCQSCYTERAIRVCPRKRKFAAMHIKHAVMRCPENWYAPKRNKTVSFLSDSRKQKCYKTI